MTKFPLIYDAGNGQAIRQYWNIRHWLRDKEIEHVFEWSSTGQYLPQAVIIFDPEDAILFSLTMKHATQVVKEVE